YDYLRKHRAGPEPILAVLNFEIPSAKNSTLALVGRSNQTAPDEAFKEANLNQLYPLSGALEIPPKLPRDITPPATQDLYPHATLAVDDFTFAEQLDSTTDGDGKATFTFSAAAVAMGSGGRYVHVTAGPDYPLVEEIVQVE